MYDMLLSLIVARLNFLTECLYCIFAYTSSLKQQDSCIPKKYGMMFYTAMNPSRAIFDTLLGRYRICDTKLHIYTYSMTTQWLFALKNLTYIFLYRS